MTWQYREFSDPAQRLPGVAPLEGTAEAEVHGGRITRLTLVDSPASVLRQRGELAAYAAMAPVPRGAAAGGGRAVEPTDAAWPLALGGLAGLGIGAAALRQRARQR